jgi:WhiB family redox-sensing transcriptional regulator
MTSLGHSDQQHTDLLRAIHRVGGVPCEDHPSLFFPEDIPDAEVRRESIKAAKKLCKGCPIKAHCLSYAMTTNQQSGIWGGTLPSER